MADALVSPAVGGTLWIVSGGLIAYCARKVRQTLRENLVPLMGVLGAFVFAAQMINFTIPGTGSSGHLGGGLLLAALLGPHAAFLVIASVLTVQALFFADGGLLALGCNIFNLGFFPAFVAYSLIYRPIVGLKHGTSRGWVGAILAGLLGLQLGALGVVVETTASGISDLPFRMFALLMLPIHLAIGVVEGLATAAVVAFVARARPEAIQAAPAGAPAAGRAVLIGLAVAAVLAGGVVSWFASTHPDGLEWSIAKVTGRETVSGGETAAGVRERLAAVQEKTAVLPDYGFRTEGADAATATPAQKRWPAANAGTSVSGLVGSLVTLALVAAIGFAIKTRSAAQGTRARETPQ